MTILRPGSRAVLHRVIAAFLVVVAAMGCGRKNAASPEATRGDAAPPPAALDVPAPPARSKRTPPHPRPDAFRSSAGAGGPDGFAPCNPEWSSRPTPRSGCRARSPAASPILVEHAGAPVLLLIGGDPPQTTSVGLPDAPPEGADPGSCGPLHGVVASSGGRFLVAWGRVAVGRLAVRVRAVVPSARLLPVDLPGRPGAAGEPALEGPAAGESVEIGIDPYPAAVLVTAWGPDGSASATVSPTGAPLDAGKLGWSLVTAPPGSESPWLLPPPLADSMAVRYVGPLGDAALAVDEGAGTVVLVRAGSAAEPFRLSTVVPGPREAVWFAPGRVFRLQGEAGPWRGVAYDAQGRVAVRLDLPAGSTPLAVSRDGRSVLFVGEVGAIGSCGGTTAAPAPPSTRAALNNPGSGGDLRTRR